VLSVSKIDRSGLRKDVQDFSPYLIFTWSLKIAGESLSTALI